MHERIYLLRFFVPENRFASSCICHSYKQYFIAGQQQPLRVSLSFFLIPLVYGQTQKIQLFWCNVQYARFVLYGECVAFILAVNGGIRSSSFAVVVYIFYFVFVCNTLRVTDRSNEFSSGNNYSFHFGKPHSHRTYRRGRQYCL